MTSRMQHPPEPPGENLPDVVPAFPGEPSLPIAGQTSAAPPARRGHPVVAWIVILTLVALTVLTQSRLNYRQIVSMSGFET